MTNHTNNVRQALDTVWSTKAPTKKAAAIAAALISLPTQAEVDDFTATLRRDAHVQDVTLLPTDNTAWTVRRWVKGEGRLVEHGSPVTTAVLLNTLADAENVRIDWPSVTFHWGVGVDFTWGGEDFVAQTQDFRMAETYMSY